MQPITKIRRSGALFTRTLLLLAICGYFAIQSHLPQGIRKATCNQDLYHGNCSDGKETESGSWRVLQQYEQQEGIATVVGNDKFTPEIGTSQDSESSGTHNDANAIDKSSVSISPGFKSDDTLTTPRFQPSKNNPFSIYEASKIVDAALNPKDMVAWPDAGHELIQLRCGYWSATRYNYLKPAALGGAPSKPRYYFALDLHQSAQILPRLLSSIIEAMYFLGPEHCILSITEGRSTDGTLEALTALEPAMEHLGVVYVLTRNDLNPLGGDVDRVQALAELRNQVLSPLLDRPQEFDPNTVIIFINDVSLCVEDILELLHQRVYQSADMTCAMDWINNGSLFYDVWISRQMNGDSFFEIPQSGSWEFAANLFWNEPSTQARLDHGQPIQVFSCWNGATVFTAKPVMEQKIKFRSARPGECRLGEPTHFCKDMWKEGYKRIAVIPTVNVGYSDEQSRLAKERHGSVSSWLEKEDPSKDLIFWDVDPPQKIKCLPSWDSPSMVRWDQ